MNKTIDGTKSGMELNRDCCAWACLEVCFDKFKEQFIRCNVEGSKCNIYKWLEKLIASERLKASQMVFLELELLCNCSTGFNMTYQCQNCYSQVRNKYMKEASK